MIFTYIKIIFICLKHGINPFSSVQKSIGKAAKRFTDGEKQFYINSCKSECTKKILRRALYTDGFVDCT